LINIGSYISALSELKKEVIIKF